MELFKIVPANLWLFIYFRKYWDLCKVVKKPLKNCQDQFFRCIAHLGFDFFINFVFIKNVKFFKSTYHSIIINHHTIYNYISDQFQFICPEKKLFNRQHFILAKGSSEWKEKKILKKSIVFTLVELFFTLVQCWCQQELQCLSKTGLQWRII